MHFVGFVPRYPPQEIFINKSPKGRKIFIIMRNGDKLRDQKRNGKQYAFFLDAIDGDSYGVDFSNDTERINFFFDTFRKEFGFNIARMGIRAALTEYLKGLPSCIHIPFYNNEIIELGKSWGYCETEQQKDRFIENYWQVSANRLIYIYDYLSEN